MYWGGAPLLRAHAGDAAVSAAALTGATALVGATKLLRARGILSGRASRKVVHTLSGIAFVLLWPLYTEAGRQWAACVPAFALLSLAALSGPIARTVARDDAPALSDALRGPIVYTGVLLATTLLLWKQPAAYVVIAQLCIGDAAAEIVGRRFGAGSPWPFSKSKSAAGSAAFAASAGAGTLALLAFYQHCELGASAMGPATLAAVAIISLSCAAAELIPECYVGDDNASIAVTAAVLSRLLLR